MMSSRTCGEVENWMRLGCDAELPLPVLVHVAECPDCRRLVDDVRLVRGTVAAAWVHKLSESRLDSIEAALRVEVRTAPSTTDVPRGHRVARLGAIALVGVLLGAAAMAAVHVAGPTRPAAATEGKVTPSVDVQVTQIGRARGAKQGTTSTAPYRLEEGVVEFDVTRATEASPYRVSAGSYTIEATKARFRVEVTQGEVERIEVAAGEAKAKSGGGDWVKLAAGQSHQPTVLAKAQPELPETGDRSQPNRPTVVRQAPNQAPSDEAFAQAYSLYQSGQSSAAAKAFDVLLVGGTLDATRRCDALYWAAQAYSRGVNPALAESRARALVEGCPNGLRFGDGALLLGEYAEARGDLPAASRYYRTALGAAQPATRGRARQALARAQNRQLLK